MGDRTGDQDPGAVGNLQQLPGRNDAQVVEAGAQELRRITVGRDAGGPDVGGGQFRLAHPGQRRNRRRRTHPGQAVRTLGRGRTGGPQSLPPGDSETAQSACGGQRLGLGNRQLDPAGEIEHALVRPGRLPFVDDPLCQIRADMTHRGEPQPDLQAAVLTGGVGEAGVHIGPVHDDPVPAGVGHQRLRGIEAHRLSAQQRRTEHRRMVQLEP